MQRSPAEPYPADTAASAAAPMSASGSTTMWFFAPPSACTRLPLRVPVLVDIPGHRRGADEADRRDVRVGQQRVDRRAVALHHVEDAGRRPRPVQQVGQQQRDRRVLLARLEDERVTGDHRGAEHPHRYHRREVERGDPGDHAERLADRVHVDPGRRLLGEAALEQCGRAGRELDVLDAPGQLAQRVGDRLAVLRADQSGDLLAVGVHQFRGTGTSPLRGATARPPASPGTRPGRRRPPSAPRRPKPPPRPPAAPRWPDRRPGAPATRQCPLWTR